MTDPPTRLLRVERRLSSLEDRRDVDGFVILFLSVAVYVLGITLATHAGASIWTALAWPLRVTEWVIEGAFS